jgi:hypothetical protein
MGGKMRKVLIGLLMLLSITAWSAYNVGDTVAPVDDLTWTINGPTGHPEVGQSSSIFTKTSEMKAVFLFMGQTW